MQRPCGQRKCGGQRMFEEEENVHSIWSTAGKREHAGEEAGEADGARLSRGL